MARQLTILTRGSDRPQDDCTEEDEDRAFGNIAMYFLIVFIPNLREKSGGDLTPTVTSLTHREKWLHLNLPERSCEIKNKSR